MSTVATANLDSIQKVVSARYGGPVEREASDALTPNEQAALRTWANRLNRARSCDRQIALPNGKLVWA